MFAIKSIAFHNRHRNAIQPIRMIIVGIFVWLLTSCQLNVQVSYTPTLEASMTDQSLLTDQPCSAPCWYRLELGKSSKAEVLSTLESLTFANPATIHEKNYGYWDSSVEKNIPASLISIDCRTPSWQCAGLVVANDTLVSIGWFPNYNLSLLEVVNHLRPPNFVRGVLLQDGSTCKVVFSWINRQIIMESDNPSGKKLCEEVNFGKGLTPNLKITRVYYELPGKFVYEKSNGKPWPDFFLPGKNGSP